jgi:uncharacterized small protein (DUF1192 family)
VSRLLVRQAEFDGAVRLLTADIARTDPEGAERRAHTAAEQLYRVNREATR